MRKEMTFTDLLVLLLKKFNAILIVAIVAGIVLGGSGIALLVAHYSNPLNVAAFVKNPKRKDISLPHLVQS